ncbi:MAG: XdhC family protein [Deltaproteobacteria bacterium]|nr:XdhC family protein [Deltaproteobacteria bacterium]MBP6830283.1 XdhC family protein [Deltaproteobacteria bacterium]
MEAVDDALAVPVEMGVAGVLRRVAEAAEGGRAVALATVIGRHGSTPSTPGQKLARTAEGCFGTVGGGAVEAAVLRSLEEAFARAGRGEASARVETLRLGAGLGMCCGGSVDVLIEAMAAQWPVGVVGAGHLAGALVPMLVGLGFAVTVVDAREAYALAERFAGARVLCGEPRELAELVPRRGAVLAMTHDHQRDQDAVEWALREGYAYVGAVGSRAKAARTATRLEARDFSEADRGRVHIPLGVKIGARSPAEIAVSIAAAMVAWRAGAGD